MTVDRIDNREALRRLVAERGTPGVNAELAVLFDQVAGMVPDILVTIDNGHVRVVTDVPANIMFVRDGVELAPADAHICHGGAVAAEIVQKNLEGGPKVWAAKMLPRAFHESGDPGFRVQLGGRQSIEPGGEASEGIL